MRELRDGKLCRQRDEKHTNDYCEFEFIIFVHFVCYDSAEAGTVSIERSGLAAFFTFLFASNEKHQISFYTNPAYECERHYSITE